MKKLPAASSVEGCKSVRARSAVEGVEECKTARICYKLMLVVGDTLFEKKTLNIPLFFLFVFVNS